MYNIKKGIYSVTTHAGGLNTTPHCKTPNSRLFCSPEARAKVPQTPRTGGLPPFERPAGALQPLTTPKQASVIPCTPVGASEDVSPGPDLPLFTPQTTGQASAAGPLLFSYVWVPLAFIHSFLIVSKSRTISVWLGWDIAFSQGIFPQNGTLMDSVNMAGVQSG